MKIFLMKMLYLPWNWTYRNVTKTESRAVHPVVSSNSATYDCLYAMDVALSCLLQHLGNITVVWSSLSWELYFGDCTFWKVKLLVLLSYSCDGGKDCAWQIFGKLLWCFFDPIFSYFPNHEQTKSYGWTACIPIVCSTRYHSWTCTEKFTFSIGEAKRWVESTKPSLIRTDFCFKVTSDTIRL